MAVYGVNIITADGRSTTAGASNMFVLDYFYPTGHGSKSYHLEPGETLHAFPVYFSDYGGDPWGTSGPYYMLDTFSISGGTISWATAVCTNTQPWPRFYGYPMFMVYKKGAG